MKRRFTVYCFIRGRAQRAGSFKSRKAAVRAAYALVGAGYPARVA